MATIPKWARRGFFCALIALLCLTSLAPTAALADTDLVVGGTARVAYANGEGVYLRSNIGYNASIVTLVPEGTIVQVLDGPFTAGDGTLWYHIGVWDQIGFMVHNFLAFESGAPEAPAVADPLAEPEPELEPQAESEFAAQTAVAIGAGTIVGTNGANVRCRTEAGYHGDVITTLSEGTVVEIIGEAVVEWQPVNCGGRTGFIHSDFVLIDDAAPPEIDPAPEAEQVPEPEPVPEPEAAPEPEIEANDDDGFGAASLSTSTVTGTATVTGTNGGGLRCRSGANYDASIITVLGEGAEVALSGAASGEWQPVVCAGQDGFVHTAFITIGGADSTSTEAASTSGTGGTTITGSAAVTGTGGGGLRCRSDASFSAGTITVLAEGSTVSLRGSAVGEWQPVVCAGQNGFAHSSFLTTGGGDSNTGSGNGGSNGGESTVTGTAVVSGTGGAGVRCRAEAGYHGSVITVVSEGIEVELRGSMSGEWQPVICAKQNGFVHGDFLSFDGSGNGGSSGGNNGGGASGDITGTAVVTGTGGSGLRCRSDASTSASTITVMAEGSTVSLRGSAVGDWQPVVCAGQNGFAHSSFLGTGGGGNSGSGDTDPGNASGNSGGLSNGDHAQATANLNLRYNPSYSAGVAAVAPAGTVVQITGSPSNGFYPVNWDGLSGYMYGDYLTWTDAALSKRGGSSNPSNPGGNPGGGGGSGTGNAIVNFAMQYQGYPYVWATAGPSSFDCSGFTYWVVLNVLGIDIGRGLWTQIVAGSPVSYSNLQPGDLVFFQNTYTWGLSHVGIYIGNNQFIHAENATTGVRISDITSQYYSSRYYGARRMG